MESEEIPIIAQFLPRGGNGAVIGISELSLAGKRDAGLYPLRRNGFRGFYSIHFTQDAFLDMLITALVNDVLMDREWPLARVAINMGPTQE